MTLPNANRPNANRQVVLRARPDAGVTADLFETIEAPMPEAGPGEVLIRSIWFSVDPAMRGWIAEAANYQEPVPIGGVMQSFTVGEVMASNHPDYAVGDLVQGRQGWQQFAVSDGSNIDRKLDPRRAPISTALHVLGINGITAWAGLVDVCDPKPGETVLVTTAAGGVGSSVGQIAKIKGCRAVGITGSDDKVRMCLEEYGFDAAINYKTVPDLGKALAEACPDGIDCFFDNVGGAQFDAAMELLNPHARIAICGTISMPSFPIPNGPRVNRTLLVKRARIQGFLLFDYVDRFASIVEELTGWLADGRLKYREDVIDGIEGAPEALVRLLAGENQGKQLVRVGADP
ncbi:MAG: NADP-dependent oxidoreductase [Rhodospirillaceae bacterium]|jgi:NADPH-dependent curcumin reductase|nr:NADP-dependent oxidoreductase [Rhodospirillaceae bacterium]MBT6138232.1 NADP-dependent oxidoreductase [Rhodospirillaceae bacterium]